MTSPRMRGLGRGLDALIPMSREGEAMVPQMIAVDQIRPSHQQVRSRFDAEPLGELAESIRLHGVLQPLLVRRIGDGYELIAGERRWRAARLAGLQAVPAVVRSDAGNDAQLVLGLIENSAPTSTPSRKRVASSVSPRISGSRTTRSRSVSESIACQSRSRSACSVAVPRCNRRSAAA